MDDIQRWLEAVLAGDPPDITREALLQNMTRKSDGRSFWLSYALMMSDTSSWWYDLLVEHVRRSRRPFGGDETPGASPDHRGVVHRRRRGRHQAPAVTRQADERCPRPADWHGPGEVSRPDRGRRSGLGQRGLRPGWPMWWAWMTASWLGSGGATTRGNKGVLLLPLL